MRLPKSATTLSLTLIAMGCSSGTDPGSFTGAGTHSDTASPSPNDTQQPPLDPVSSPPGTGGASNGTGGASPGNAPVPGAGGGASEGTCTPACPTGQVCSEGSCIDPSTSPTPTNCDMASDECPFSGGLTHACVTRFSLGINYAWHEFAADFGGLAAWGKKSVSTDSATYAAELAEMSNKGAQTVRWWMFPDFRGDGVEFDNAGDPSGLTTQALTDISVALDLAEAQDVYLVLTLFSFDNFRPTREDSGVTILGMTPMVTSAARREKLISNIVRPAAQAVAASENKHRLLGWDIINEPEWAVFPEAGAPATNQFTPNDDLDAVSLTQMKALINESASALKSITPDAQISVGWAAAKWAWAFTDVTNIDFHQPHIYAWVNEWWPYTSTPAELGYTGKPTVMGEFYLAAMPFGSGPTYQQMLQSWYDNGYAGAWSWQYNENKSNLGLTQSFAADKGCPVRF